MAKDKFSRTKACATKTLYAVMKEISRRGGSMPAKELYPFVNENVELTEWEKEPAGKMKYIRWTNSFQFYSIDYQKAGFIVKKNGNWYLTPEGEAVLKKTPEEVMTIANDAYHEWRRLNPKDETPEEEPNDETAEKDNAMNLDLLESDAREGIRKFIVSKSPYEFQDMVAALLRAMGYHTPFIAPKGKDGGIDITAYLDPLGAQTPRIKVQVKHKPETAIAAKYGVTEEWMGRVKATIISHLKALVYNLMIIGEAANLLTKEFRSEHPEVPWRVIVDMRNLLNG